MKGTCEDTKMQYKVEVHGDILKVIDCVDGHFTLVNISDLILRIDTSRIGEEHISTFFYEDIHNTKIGWSRVNLVDMVYFLNFDIWKK